MRRSRRLSTSVNSSAETTAAHVGRGVGCGGAVFSGDMLVGVAETQLLESAVEVEMEAEMEAETELQRRWRRRRRTWRRSRGIS